MTELIINLCLKYKDNRLDDINLIGGSFIQYQGNYFKIEKDNINTMIAKYL